MDVISHGKLRKIQMRSNFFICESFGHESDQLLLAQGEEISSVSSFGRCA
jgi:hypothetical protein